MLALTQSENSKYHHKYLWGKIVFNMIINWKQPQIVDNHFELKMSTPSFIELLCVHHFCWYGMGPLILSLKMT